MSSLAFHLKSKVADFLQISQDETPLNRLGIGHTIALPRQIRLHIEGDDFLSVSQFFASYPAAVRQVERLLDIVTRHPLANLATIGELVLGEDDDGTPQLELYVRVEADPSLFRSLKNDIHHQFEESFIWDRRRVWPVILRKS